jgi:hypothetical protein
MDLEKKSKHSGFSSPGMAGARARGAWAPAGKPVQQDFLGVRIKYHGFSELIVLLF